MVDYINIRGHEDKSITVPFWQRETQVIHTDSSYKICAFTANKGSIKDEDNFGFYDYHNPAFKCTESKSSTTQLWFGINL